ncbi:MAG TPA: glutathione S-transferase family protein [Rhizomicrobium sp.]
MNLRKVDSMKLYYSDVLAPRKTCAVAKYLNAPVEFIYLDMAKGEHKTPAYLAINPNGKVPALVDGARIVWEADAIMCDLARRAHSDLWPQDERQVDVIRWLSWNAQHFNPSAGALYFEYIIRARFNIGPPDEAEVKKAVDSVRILSRLVDNHLRGRKWLVGDGLTIADFSLAVTLPYAQQAHIPLDEFPEMRRWHDQLNALDAWRDPFPARNAA